MDTPQTWAEALNISPEKLSEWNQSAPSGVPLLVHCLNQGLVPLDQYLEWAQKHFELAVLDPAFFRSFDRATLEPLRQAGTWSSWCFPIGAWEEVTYVACTEPPSEPLTDGKFVYVLADPKALAAAWEETSAAAKPSDAPVGLDLNAPTTFVLNLDEKLLSTAATDPHPVEVGEKTGLTLAVDLEKTKVKEAPKAPPAPPAKPAASPAPKAPASAKKSVNPAAAGMLEEVEIKNTFERLHATYSAALIMKIEDGFAKPYQWDPILKVKENREKAAVPLNQPSLFRIVTKTQQPYHGYVIDSPAHREFFGALGFSDLPGCVTAIPLKGEQDFWGLLVAIGDASAQAPQTLETATKIAEKLVQAMQSAWGLKAA